MIVDLFFSNKYIYIYIYIYMEIMLRCLAWTSDWAYLAVDNFGVQTTETCMPCAKENKTLLNPSYFVLNGIPKPWIDEIWALNINYDGGWTFREKKLFFFFMNYVHVTSIFIFNSILLTFCLFIYDFFCINIKN